MLAASVFHLNLANCLIWLLCAGLQAASFAKARRQKEQPILLVIFLACSCLSAFLFAVLEAQPAKNFLSLLTWAIVHSAMTVFAILVMFDLVHLLSESAEIPARSFRNFVVLTAIVIVDAFLIVRLLAGPGHALTVELDSLAVTEYLVFAFGVIFTAFWGVRWLHFTGLISAFGAMAIADVAILLLLPYARTTFAASVLACLYALSRLLVSLMFLMAAGKRDPREELMKNLRVEDLPAVLSVARELKAQMRRRLI